MYVLKKNLINPYHKELSERQNENHKEIIFQSYVIFK